MLHETFNWKSLSIIGALALWRFYFQIHTGSIKSLQVVEFLRHLQRHIPGKMLVIWDGAPIHRSTFKVCAAAGSASNKVPSRQVRIRLFMVFIVRSAVVVY